MSKRKINEAGNFGKLTPAEVQILRSYSPEFSNSVGNIISTFRSKGKQIDLPQAVNQLQQVGYKSPEVDKFLQSSALIAPMQNVQQDPFKKRDSVPGQQKIVPPTAQGQLTDKNAPIKQRLQMAGQKPMAPKAVPAAPTPFDKFEQMRTGPVSNDEMMQQQRQGNQQQMPITNRQQLKNKWAAKGGVDPLAKTSMQMEAISPAMASGKLKQIMDILRRLKPEDLMAINNFINSLNAGTRQGSSAMVSSSTQLNAGKQTNMKSKQQIMTEVLRVKITEQKKARDTAQHLLEGPLGNVWDRIKGAGTAVGQKMGLMGGQQDPQQMAGVDENSKRAAQELQKVLGKVNQFRSKFNSSILKNAESMNGYHDLVLNAVQMYQQYQNILGPFGQQLVKQIHDAVGQLVYDLTSEKEQIDTFLKQLKDMGMAKSAKSLGNDAKKRAEISRAAENPDTGLANMRRHMPMGGGTMDPKFGDQANKDLAMNKFRGGDKSGAMNDLQKLYMKQIERDKAKPKKSAKKSKKKAA
jgi:hypothetical protein